MGHATVIGNFSEWFMVFVDSAYNSQPFFRWDALIGFVRAWTVLCFKYPLDTSLYTLEKGGSLLGHNVLITGPQVERDILPSNSPFMQEHDRW